VTDFKGYNQSSDRLDTFLHQYISGKDYGNFWKVCQIVFTLSHGQSAVERGFNINDDTLETNLKELSLRSLRLVYDQIKINGSISQYDIPKELYLSCSLASAKYKKALAENKENASKKRKSHRREQLEKEFNELKRQKMDTDRLVKDLTSKMMEMIGKGGNMDGDATVILVTLESIRKTIKEKENISLDQRDQLKKLEAEIKKDE
jgi:hypothetical protein